jgi:ABC-2 type transport system permease protein
MVSSEAPAPHVGGIAHGLGVAARQLRASLMTDLQYRGDLAFQLVTGAFWAAWTLGPLLVVFELRPTLAGLERAEAATIMGVFVLLKALLEGVIGPNLVRVVEHVRRGTLDFVLLKPVDAQLLVSSQRVVVAKAVDAVTGLLVLAWAIAERPTWPAAGDVLVALVLFGASAALLYALFLMGIAAAFWLVKVDNLVYLFSAIFDAARWPVGVFRGLTRIVLTYVVPVALMTSYPALALLGRLDARDAVVAVALALGFTLVARRVWRFALAPYPSASS